MAVTEQSVMGVIRAARPTFRNAHDKIAFAVHSSFLASGFILHATGPSAFTDDALYSSSTDEVGIEHWNELDDDYGFVYSNSEKGSKKILVKCVAMNDKLIVDALREGDSDPAHIELNVKDYVADEGGNNYTSMFKDFKKLVADIDKEILCKYNGSRAAGLSTQKDRGELRDNTNQRQGESGIVDSTFYPPAPGYNFIVPPVPDIGGSDLFPGPGAGVYPTRGDFSGGGSMLVGPNDPRFFGGGVGVGVGREPRIPGRIPGVVPPGARFDPYGPPGIPGFEPNRFVRDPRRPGHGTHPDLEPFGNDSDYI